MDHAILALRVAALVAVAAPVGVLDVFLEGFYVAVLQQIAGLLPAEDVIGRAAPRRALEVEVALQELEEERGEVEFPALLGVGEDVLEELLAGVAMEEVGLVRSLFVDVAGREHHALDAQFHGVIKEGPDVRGVSAIEEGRVSGDAEAHLDRELDRLDRDVVGTVAADRRVVLVLLAVEVDGEGEILRGLEEAFGEPALEEKSVGAEINVLFAGNETLDDLLDLGMDQRFPAGDADHGCAAFLDRVEALLGREALVENVGRILDFAATRAGEIAPEQRLEHEHKRIALAAHQLLFQNVGGNRPGLGDRNHSGIS